MLKWILLLAVLAGGWLYFNMGGLITRTAEKIASDALGVKVDIGSIDLSLSDKTVTVHGLEVANPLGYRKPHAMTAGKIRIVLNDASKQLIDFKDIQVKDSVVNLEVNEKGMNLTDLKRLATRREQQESVGSEQVRVIIQRMVIDASTINTSITLLDRDIAPIKMPPVRFTGIGHGGGSNADEVIVRVMTRYLGEIENFARREGALRGIPGVDGVKKTLDDAAGGLQKLFR